MKMDANDTLVLVIDYQEKIVPVMSESKTLIANTKKLLEGMKVFDIPMVVTQQYTRGLGMTLESIQDLLKNDEGFKYYDKVLFSCYEDEDIKRAIKESGRKNIVICGIETHICVLQTMLDLLEDGYHVVLVQDCVSSRKESDKAVALQRAVHEGAVITTCESILFEFTKEAGSESFKAISKIIK